MNHPAVAPKHDLRAHYLDVRRMTERLCAPLSAEDQMVQPMPDASPAKWHQAHTTWFFETFILAPHVPGYRPFDERFPFIFNSYYKQLGGHPVRANRGFMSRPSLEEVRAYRAYVDDALVSALDRDLPPDIGALVELGLNHEQQHQELILTDVKYALWSQPLQPAYRNTSAGNETGAPLSRSHNLHSASRFVFFPGGVYEIGHDGLNFAYDNESPRHQVLLTNFELGSRLVTCGEYLEFIADGGYRRPDLWLSDGWDTVLAQRWAAPLYWEERDGHWFEFTLDGFREIDPAEPVCHVSYYEADAYARWAKARLPLESEWEIAASNAASSGNLLESDSLHPRPLSTPSDESTPIAQLFGDVWEWTASPYVGYPGFAPAAGAIGEYNGKFMCNQFVLRGGSCATPGSHIRATYRNFFPPHARWQFMGIRLAR